MFALIVAVMTVLALEGLVVLVAYGDHADPEPKQHLFHAVMLFAIVAWASYFVGVNPWV